MMSYEATAWKSHMNTTVKMGDQFSIELLKTKLKIEDYELTQFATNCSLIF